MAGLSTRCSETEIGRGPPEKMSYKHFQIGYDLKYASCGD